MTKLKLGYIGVGLMGLPMIRHLAAKGYSIAAFDVVAEKRVAAAGAGARILCVANTSPSLCREGEPVAAPCPMPGPCRHPLIVERYAIYDMIASGGMATVHFARLLGAQGFRRTVAAKRLMPHLTQNPDFSLMLVDEARIAARIRHPNVVSTLDVVQTESELVLVMDYVHGESLSKLCRAAHLRGEMVPRAIAAAIIIDTLHGLHAAHEAKDERGEPLGIVHRDVSPQNLLVGADGITRIADFGIAMAAGRLHNTSDGAIKGKLSYMAPEQLNQGSVTRLTDVFAASVVLWELLTGRSLFEGKNQAETVFRVTNGPIPLPSSCVADLGSELDLIVARGLSRVPEERFATARDMALALEAWAAPTRPSEIAAWVERIAVDSLAQRQRVLSRMDGESPPPLEPVTGVRPTRLRAPRLLFAAVSLLLLGIGLFVLTEQRTAQPSAPLPDSKVRAAALPPTVTRKPAATTAVPASQLPRPALSAGSDSADEPPRDRAPEHGKAGADTVRERARGPSPTRGPTPHPRIEDTDDACDPPFSVDGMGRHIFKVECM